MPNDYTCGFAISNRHNTSYANTRFLMCICQQLGKLFTGLEERNAANACILHDLLVFTANGGYKFSVKYDHITPCSFATIY